MAVSFLFIILDIRSLAQVYSHPTITEMRGIASPILLEFTSRAFNEELYAFILQVIHYLRCSILVRHHILVFVHVLIGREYLTTLKGTLKVNVLAFEGKVSISQ